MNESYHSEPPDPFAVPGLRLRVARALARTATRPLTIACTRPVVCDDEPALACERATEAEVVAEELRATGHTVSVVPASTGAARLVSTVGAVEVPSAVALEVL